MRIDCVRFDGKVPRSESDEYVQITNVGKVDQELRDWVVRDKTDPHQAFRFPTYLLGPGQTTRVYTNEIHHEWGGFSFGRRSAIWSNTSPDTAELVDDAGNTVSEMSYDVRVPPGCPG